jgi:hypothetical protein
MLRFRAKHFAQDFLLGLDEFESAKADFPFQNGILIPVILTGQA